MPVQALTTNDFKIAPGATPEQLAKFDLALTYLQSSLPATVQANLVSNNGATIVLNNNFDVKYDGSTNTIYWDPRGALIVDSWGGTQSPAVQLAHEFAHAGDMYFLQKSSAEQEQYAQSITNAIAESLNEPLRATYNDVQGWQSVPNPTQHSETIGSATYWTEMSQSGATYIGGLYTPTPNISTDIIGPSIDPAYYDPFECIGYWALMDEEFQNGPYVWVADPVVVNFAGGLVNTVSAEQSDVRFDLRSNGTSMATSWLAEGEGFLVFNRGESPITNVKDLVPSLAALRTLDSNNDSVLNTQDAHWNELSIWADTHKGQFSESDMHTLSDLHIVQINLDIQVDTQKDDAIIDRATIVFDSGTLGEIASVALMGQPVQPAMNTALFTA